MKTASISRIPDLTAARRLLAAIAACALAVGVTACGSGDEAPTTDKAKPKSEATTAKKPKSERATGNPNMANAVVTSKSSAAVDLQFDIASKPQPGQPFEITLSFAPRLAADSLEVEVTGMPGLTVVNGGAAKFPQVQPATTHEAKVLVNADEAGLYYVNVIAKMVSKVQTDARTFSVPVVVGGAMAMQKPATEPTTTDPVTGERVQSAKAVETTGDKQTP